MNLTDERTNRLLLSAHTSGLEYGRLGASYCHNPYCPVNEGGMWEAWDDGWSAAVEHVSVTEEAA